MNARTFTISVQHKYYGILWKRRLGAKRFRPTRAQHQSNAAYCMDLLRKYDYENFLCTLLLPESIRRTAFTIRAFSIELAQVRDLVSKTEIGRMRIQFWQDTLERIYKENPPQQPVAQELALAVKSKQLSKQWLGRMVESREDLITDKPHASLQAAEDYAEKSTSSAFYLLLQAAGTQDMQCDHVASHVGKLQGLTNLIRGVPFNASRGRVYLPVETMAKCKVSQEAVVRGSTDTKEVIYDIGCAAYQHLEMARKLRSSVPADVRPIFLPAVSCDKYLQKLRLADFNVFDPKLQRRNHYLPISLLWHKLARKY